MAPVSKRARVSLSLPAATLLMLVGMVSGCDSDPMDASPTALSTPSLEANLRSQSGSGGGSVKSWPTSWSLVVGPASAQVQTSQTLKFKAIARSSSGDSISVLVDWSASGGTIFSRSASLAVCRQ